MTDEEKELAAVDGWVRYLLRAADVLEEAEEPTASHRTTKAATALGNAYRQQHEMIKRSGLERQPCAACKKPMLPRAELHQTVSPYCVDCAPYVVAAIEKGKAKVPECCGLNRASKFCPDCGKALAEPFGLGALLAHCRVSLGKAQQTVKEHEDGDRTYGSLTRKQINVEKWKSWTEQLAEIVLKQSDPPNDT